MPKVTIFVPLQRVFGIGPFALIGLNYDARSFAGTQNNDMIGAGWPLPIAADPSYPISAGVVVASGLAYANVATAVTLRIRATRLTSAAAVAELSLFNTVPVPDNWPLNVPVRHTFDNGSGYTWPGGTFAQDDYVGFAWGRQGLDVNDTYTSALLVGSSLFVTYHQRCQLVCCP
jgi:hypothetical protein